ncbi:hypothetical protein JCM19046_3385 [Bacillus sp. JCM 19046]|nr:hypothetical protein JCM19045_883 [Bacillus sp. JCM 19045]GAF18788.1 hypothetical protein JCM19046_3385 [Bacillus sp. JCM 19046]
MKQFVVIMGVSLVGIVGAYILSLIVDASGFPAEFVFIPLFGIVIGLLAILISKVNKLLNLQKRDESFLWI